METLTKKAKASTGTYSNLEEVVASKINQIQKILEKMPADTKKKVFTK
jgi:hypothetical protein